MHNNLQIYQWYLQLTGGRSFSDAKLAFTRLTIQGNHSGDNYFESFGVGNVLAFADRPFERFSCYEFLLTLCHDIDPVKYFDIHKGTPFYFLAWLALELKDYRKATFYIDAAVAEDIRAESGNKGRGLSRPMGQLLALRPENEKREKYVAWRITQELKDVFSVELENYKKDTGRGIDIERFVNRFVFGMIKKNIKNRSIISAFYSFLLEHKDNCQMFNLRSKDKGTIEPIVIHFLKGALIFETLLKTIFPKQDNGKIIETLGGFYKNKTYKAAGYPNLEKKSIKSCKSFRQLVGYINRQRGLSRPTHSFKNSARVRNMTSHTLKWDDVFSSIDNYRLIYAQERNAIFDLLNDHFLA